MESGVTVQDDLTVYEAPAVMAVFPKDELIEELPEELAPHIHAVQNS